MRTIRPYTREERRRVLEELTPRLVERFGDRLRALAVQASVARGDDGPHSDLELVAIVRDGPRGGAGVIHRGMLIELEWMTEAQWLASCRSVTSSWPAAGSSCLEPIAGDGDLILRLDAHETSDLQAGCRRQAAKHWAEVQESTSKVLTAIHARNQEGLGLLAWMMILDMLQNLSLLNETPYTTLARFVTEARALPHQPAGFGELLDLFVEGRYGETERLRTLIVQVIDGFEAIYEERGMSLGESDLDRLLPADA